MQERCNLFVPMQLLIIFSAEKEQMQFVNTVAHQFLNFHKHI